MRYRVTHRSAATRPGLTQVLGAMRYIFATLTSTLMLLAGLALGGTGHGWVAGAFGCFALVPLSFLVVANGLSRTPSSQVAMAALAVGIAVCVGVAFATVSNDHQELAHYTQIAGKSGVLVASAAYLGWLLTAALAVIRARRAQRIGA